MKRQTYRHFEKRFNNEGRLICLIPTCNKLAEKRKRGNMYRNYCEDHNHEDMQIFTNWRSLANKAIRRDGYKCVKCGINQTCENYLEVDHIIEVAAGGDQWDLNNLQTLCKKCHKQKTAAFLKKKNTTIALHQGMQQTLKELKEKR